MSHIKLRKSLLIDVVQVLLSSSLLAFSFPSSGASYHSYLAWVAFIPALHVFERSGTIRRLVLSLLWVGLTALVTFRGVSAAIGDYFKVPGISLMTAIALLSWGFWPIFAWMMGWIKKSSIRYVLYPALWVSLEYLFGFTSPQARGMTLGLTQVNLNFLNSWAGWSGVYGLSGWAFSCNCIIYQYIQNYRNLKNYIITGFFILLALFFKWQSSLNEQETALLASPVKIALLQPNVYPKSMNADPYQERIEVLRRQTRDAILRGAEAIFWPAASIQAGSKEALMSHFNFLKEFKGRPEIIFGGLMDFDEGGRVQRFNMIVQMDLSKNIKSLWTKKKLTPFSEYVPWFCPDLLSIKNSKAITYEAAKEGDTIFHFDNLIWANLICVEVLYPSLIRDFVNEGAQALAIFSNDYMYRRTPMPQYMLSLARLRAKEFGLPVMRVTTDGVTAVIDSLGKIVRKSSRGQKEILFFEMNLGSRHTFYSRIGNWIGIAGTVMLWVGSFLSFCPRLTTHDSRH